MKQCNEKYENVVFFVWRWEIGVRGTAECMFNTCDNLEEVKRRWQRLRKKYPHGRLYVHRFKVVDSVDNCMKRKETERLCSVLKGLEQVNGNIHINQH